MTRLVVDIEANNLYQDVTEVHCIVAKDIDTNQYYIQSKGVNAIFKANSSVIEYSDIKYMLRLLLEADQIIGHNFIDYDIRVLEKLHPVKFNVNKIVDTMLFSYMLDPHRKKHPECPPSQLIEGKRRPIGAHSLKNWGYIVGRGKVEHEEWDKFTKEMLHRCIEDVEITELVAKELGII